MRRDALAAIRDRIDRTLDDPEPGYPHVANQGSGSWTRSAEGDWTGGFWVGQLWLAHALTGADSYRDAARLASEGLEPRARSATVFRGFLFWYGSALGAVLLDDPGARQRALVGASGLASSFDTVARLMPLGATAEEAQDVGDHETNIDGVPGGTPLLAWAARHGGDPAWDQLAREHALRHAALTVREDGSVCQSASFDRDTGALIRRYTHKGARDDSTWARAQAWALLGFAQAMAWWPEEFAGLSNSVAEWWLDHLPADCVAYWDFDVPQSAPSPRDTSATAIASASLLKLAHLIPERRDAYRDAAASMVDALVAHHVDRSSDGPTRGVLRDGCYDHRRGIAVEAELIWGDYFLMEALMVLEGRIDPVRV